MRISQISREDFKTDMRQVERVNLLNFRKGGFTVAVKEKKNRVFD